MFGPLEESARSQVKTNFVLLLHDNRLNKTFGYTSWNYSTLYFSLICCFSLLKNIPFKNSINYYLQRNSGTFPYFMGGKNATTKDSNFTLHHFPYTRKE